MVLFQGKLYFFQGSRGVQRFPGGGGGVKMPISIETCDFPGGRGVGPDLHMQADLILRWAQIPTCTFC